MAGIKPAKPAKPAPIGIADGLDPVFPTAPAGPGEEPEPEDDPALAELQDATDALRTGERAFAADIGQRLRQRLLARGGVVVRTCPRGALACFPRGEPAAREDIVERLQQGKEALLLGIAALGAADEVERIAEFARRDLGADPADRLADEIVPGLEARHAALGARRARAQPPADQHQRGAGELRAVVEDIVERVEVELARERGIGSGVDPDRDDPTRQVAGGTEVVPGEEQQGAVRDAEALRPAEHAVPQDRRGDRRRQSGGIEDAGDVVPDQRGRPVAQRREQPLADLLVVAARGVRPDLGDVPGRERRDAGGQQGLARPLHRRVHGERRSGQPTPGGRRPSATPRAGRRAQDGRPTESCRTGT